MTMVFFTERILPAILIASPWIVIGISVAWEYWRGPLRFFRLMHKIRDYETVLLASNAFLPKEYRFTRDLDSSFDSVFLAFRDWSSSAFFNNDLAYKKQNQRIKKAKKYEKVHRERNNIRINGKAFSFYFSLINTFLSDCFNEFEYYDVDSYRLPHLKELSSPWMPWIDLMDHNKEYGITSEGYVVLRLYLASLTFFNEIGEHGYGSNNKIALIKKIIDEFCLCNKGK